ncbi:L,D-transpeptidase-like protein [Antricoccus suffuscus]|uniref:L,D-transpeptidase-like protein n=1 Tax=Antricoccus suffuscus TaxID=1629062 RepID=A0A2T1A2C5_9ACTN|nr:Ig-like domain repeat protein [Antricoccus suffuscus]PRZ42752.1 L,D-transpeptidase-like protein [Antricoccus suffuscus]
MNALRTTRRHKATLLAASIAAALIGLSGCVAASPNTQNVGATKSGTQSTRAESSAPSSSASPSESAPADPTTPAPPPGPDPATLNQPTVVYLGANWKIKPSTTAKVTITVETPNPGVPHGDVSLLKDGQAYASATLNEAGKATFEIPGLTPGDYKISASFAGNENYVAGTAATKTLHMMTEKEANPPPPVQGNGVPANNQCPSTATACVDLTDNLTWIQSDGQVTYGPVKMIAGKAGARTPTGTFHVYLKQKMHYSKEFDNAPMPYSVFFVGGVAFHQGSLSNPSAGCVHLSQTSAVQFYQMLSNGDTVYVYGAAQY